MILEVAALTVKPGQERAFEAAFAEAAPIITRARGHLAHQLQHCVERANGYLLLVWWRTLEDHTEGFRGSADYQIWRKLLHHFYDPFPVVEHFRLVRATGEPPKP
ncbi:MAG TPA: antibiotic biosynthesis monooxygenase [Candidatus Cybelea sp.]|nr:antibiotic biosynthesis monooxygenase [Candidatus Cybelea sp.]